MRYQALHEHLHARLAKCAIASMSLGLTRPPLADSTMLTLTSHYTATNAKHHRYAAANLPTARTGAGPRGAPGWRGASPGWRGRETGLARPGDRAGAVPGLGPLTVRDTTGVSSRPRHERSGYFPRCKRSEIPVGQQDGLRTRAGRHPGRDLGKGHDGRDWVSGIDPGLAGHVRLAGNVEHRNPSASDIHPRNRTPAGNV